MQSIRNCKCQECGKKFKYGDEGDNEKFCLRCERESLVSEMSEDEYENLDIRESAMPAQDDIWVTDYNERGE